MLEISTRKIARVIVRAREIDAKVARWDSPGDGADADSILESRRGDATEQELRTYISDLNDDEKASLVAVMWIGRETFDAEDLAEAIQTAKEEATAPTEDYLLGIPLLSDYLEDGLEALGFSIEEVEEGIL
jgi:ParB-like chromosome segregation protein Spo0J